MWQFLSDCELLRLQTFDAFFVTFGDRGAFSFKDSIESLLDLTIRL